MGQLQDSDLRSLEYHTSIIPSCITTQGLLRGKERIPSHAENALFESFESVLSLSTPLYGFGLVETSSHKKLFTSKTL